jgi:hypothetical protein
VDIIRDGEYIDSITYDNREAAIGAYSDFRRSYGDDSEYIISVTYDGKDYEVENAPH